MFNCEKPLKNENCAHCLCTKGKGIVQDVHEDKKIIQRHVNE